MRTKKPKISKRPWPPSWPDPDLKALCSQLEIDVVALSRLNAKDSVAAPVFGSIAPPASDRMAASAPDEDAFLSIIAWMRIGQALARDRPEFNAKKEKRQRGQPKLTEIGRPGIDYERYNYIRNRRRELLAAGYEGGLKNTELIEQAIAARVKLFSRSNKDVLEVSVSRGKAVWEKVAKESQTLQARRFRYECEILKSRATLLKEKEGTQQENFLSSVVSI